MEEKKRKRLKESDGMTPRTKAAQPASRLRIVSLGGVDEIGKNMTVFEYEDDIVVVDCGSIFPKEDMLGVDLVIPDVSYLVEKKRNVRGYLFTHGHEDHIGATPYILRQVPAPLYGTKLTLALVDLKLKEHRIQGIPMQVVQPRDEVRLGKNFTAKFIHVSHSIAGACAIALTCPAGTVVVTGDFKIDYTPVDGHITDLASFAELGERGVLAMLCESTNVVRPGHEKSISRVIDQLYRCGANVIYKALAEVHVSGHACQEELKLMHALVKPKYFIPVHGEYRMLWQHAVLAESMGMNSTDIVIPETGQVVEMNQEGLYLAEQIPTGAVLVDGLGIGDVGNVVLRDRKHLSQDGLIIVVMAINRDDQRLVSGPDIISRGFIYVRENEDIIENTRDVVRQILSQSSLAGEDWPALKNRIKDELHRFIFEKIKRNPMILPIILDV